MLSRIHTWFKSHAITLLVVRNVLLTILLINTGIIGIRNSVTLMYDSQLGSNIHNLLKKTYYDSPEGIITDNTIERIFRFSYGTDLLESLRPGITKEINQACNYKCGLLGEEKIIKSLLVKSNLHRADIIKNIESCDSLLQLGLIPDRCRAHVFDGLYRLSYTMEFSDLFPLIKLIPTRITNPAYIIQDSFDSLKSLNPILQSVIMGLVCLCLYISIRLFFKRILKLKST